MQDQEQRQLRAYIDFRINGVDCPRCSSNGIDEDGSISTTIKNVGQTPASEVSICGWVIVRDIPNADDWRALSDVCSKASSKMGINPLLPQGRTDTFLLPFTKVDSTLMANSFMGLAQYAWIGEIQYTDIFGRKWRDWECEYLVPASSHPAGFATCETWRPEEEAN